MFGDFLKLDNKWQMLDAAVTAQCKERFEEIEDIRDHNQLKVLQSFRQNRVGAHHLFGSTGYGYGDAGRDMLDKVFADAVGASDALCRIHFMSGTHALTVALFGILRPGDTLLSITGSPYDTLSGVLGTGGGQFGSLKEFGVQYEQIELLNGKFSTKEILSRAKQAKVVYIQRSRGYSDRRSLSCAEIGDAVRTVKRGNPESIILVDNCYGEFCEREEPLTQGADLIAGSLIKNPGGGIAESGGYIAGRSDLVELCAHRLTAPGTGREMGSAPAGLRNLYLGLYLAPSVTAEALKSAVYASALFERLGYSVSPKSEEPRYDIITVVRMNAEDALTALCGAIQAYSPVDSFAVPQAWEMPGYDHKVIMAAGAFTCGSSIELSCDAPIKPPYFAYLQGGISFAASRYALLMAAQKILEKGQ